MSYGIPLPLLQVSLTHFFPEHLAVGEEAVGQLGGDPAVDPGVRLVAGAGDLVGVAGAVVASGEGGVAQAVAEQPRLRPPPEHSLPKIVTYHEPMRERS